jgi:hypothetical protein
MQVQGETLGTPRWRPNAANVMRVLTLMLQRALRHHHRPVPMAKFLGRGYDSEHYVQASPFRC